MSLPVGAGVGVFGRFRVLAAVSLGIRDASPASSQGAGSIRFFVGEAVKYSLFSGLRKPLFKQDGKLIHRRFPIKGSPHRFIEHIA